MKYGDGTGEDEEALVSKMVRKLLECTRTIERVGKTRLDSIRGDSRLLGG